MTKRTGTMVLAFLLAATLGSVAACKKKPPTTTEEAGPLRRGWASPRA